MHKIIVCVAGLRHMSLTVTFHGIWILDLDSRQRRQTSRSINEQREKHIPGIAGVMPFLMQPFISKSNEQ